MPEQAGTAAACSDIAAFLAFLEVERQMSAHTIDAYRRDLNLLLAWCTANACLPVRQMAAGDIRAFIAAEHRRGTSPQSVHRRLSACRSFFTWLHKRGQIAHNPASAVRAPKAARKLPQVLDVDATVRLVTVPQAVPLGVRDRAMLELLYSSGLRVSELCGLVWTRLDMDAGLVQVVGKGSKERLVPVGSHACQALRHWQAESGGQGDMPVFPGRHGKPLSARAVQLRIKQLAQRQGIHARVHPHLLRHCFATHLLESSGDLRAVQELLGHADIAATQIYTHLDFQHLAKVYDQTHPRARRKGAGQKAATEPAHDDSV